MARSLLPFVQNGYYASRNWIPLVKGNGFTTSGGGEQEEVWETASGPIVTFDAVPAPLRQLSVAFSPVQDLHGYDSPWPAGGGKNKFAVPSDLPITSKGITLFYDGYHYVVTGTATGTVRTQELALDLAVGVYILSANQTSDKTRVLLYKNGKLIRSQAKNDAAYSFNVESGDVIACGLQILSSTENCTIEPQIESGSTATTYSPYSNECPISGWDSLNVEQRGKNLFSGEKLANASISASGTLESNNSNDVLIARVFEGETYTFSLNPNGVTVGGLFTDYPTMDSVTYNNARLYLSGSESYTYTIPQGVKYIGVRYLKTFTEYQIVLGSTLPAEYTPYNPSSRSISITIGQTVYSGTVDVVTGVVTVTMASVDLSTCTFTKYGTSPVYYTTPSDKKAGNENIISDTFFLNAVAIANMSDGGMRGYSSNGNVYFCKTDCPTLADFESFVSTNKPTLVYELATPIPIQLTPQEVESLAGDNVVWSTANGDLTVEYRAQ